MDYNLSDTLKFNNNDKILNFKVIKKLGKGSYGEIFLVNNLKKSKNEVFKILNKENKYVRNNLHEISIIKKIKNYIDKEKSVNSNYIEFVSLYIDNFFYNSHHFIVLKFYNKNLFEKIIEPNNIVDSKIILKISKYILEGLLFLKKNNIIHGDLKPENILFYNDKSYRVVICDFNLSMEYDKLNYDFFDFNIQSIWYRAPEILFYIKFDYNIDIWSFGCILFEMFYFKPLFTCKTDEGLFEKIYTFLGRPNLKFIKNNKGCRRYFNSKNEPLTFTNSYNVYKMNNYKSLLDSCSNDLIKSLIKETLIWYSNKRFTVEDCLKMYKN